LAGSEIHRYGFASLRAAFCPGSLHRLIIDFAGPDRSHRNINIGLFGTSKAAKCDICDEFAGKFDVVARRDTFGILNVSTTPT
jgi:hypothetical protein